MKSIIAIFILILPIFLLFSCNKRDKISQNEEKVIDITEKVTFAAEQVSVIKLYIGTMSGLLLNTTVKTNGVVSVLNQNKAVLLLYLADRCR